MVQRTLGRTAPHRGRKNFFLNPEETGDPSISYLDLGKAKSFSFTGAFIPFQTAPETVADFIPDDGSYTMDEAGLWTHELLRGWPVRFG